MAPAVLLSLPGSACDGRGQAAAQYLFNVPEGFSRLVLEHRLRPGVAVSALWAMGSCEDGGSDKATRQPA